MEKSIKVQRTAHYYTQLPNQAVESLLIVIHGYAQLAQDFLTNFHALKNSNVFVIAPEALSKFYNKERKPVANWMTSYKRDDEIQDYVNYLNQLVPFISKEYQGLPINVLGFSQGVSTLMRWVTQSTICPQKIHLCSGSIPPELTVKEFERLQTSQFYYYYGSEDRLLKEKDAKLNFQFLESLAANSKFIPFSGTHEIPRECIYNLSLV